MQNSSGKVLVDAQGQMFDAVGVGELPFGLGSLAQVGIERVSDESTWHTETATTLLRVVPATARTAQTAVYLPAVQRVEYERGEPGSDGLLTVKKHLEIATLSKVGGRPLMRLATEGSFRFDRRAARFRSGRFTGSYQVSDETRTVNVPLSYSYQQLAACGLDQPEAETSAIGGNKRAPLRPEREAEVARRPLPDAAARAKATRPWTRSSARIWPRPTRRPRQLCWPRK